MLCTDKSKLGTTSQIVREFQFARMQPLFSWIGQGMGLSEELAALGNSRRSSVVG